MTDQVDICYSRRCNPSVALAQSRRMAASGLRVLALGYGRSIGELVFAGIVGMEDPPRHGVVESVRHLRAGGVKVMMLTGDAKETALAIAERCGIIGDHDIETEDQMEVDHAKRPHRVNSFDVELAASESLSGAELDEIPPQSLADSIAGVKVFYRVVPRHKLALVRALQQKGEIVAMTGDGVNDATALKGMFLCLKVMVRCLVPVGYSHLIAGKYDRRGHWHRHG
jgi:Ca2+-transporting ATPase